MPYAIWIVAAPINDTLECIDFIGKLYSIISMVLDIFLKVYYDSKSESENVIKTYLINLYTLISSRA